MSNQNNQSSTTTFEWNFEDDKALQIQGRKLLFFAVVFTIIVLFTALFMCSRWIFRNRSLLGSIPTHHAPSVTSSPSQGLDPDAIKKLPIILYQTNCSNRALEETECCICLSAFRDGDKLKVLQKCDHCFHCECVDAWLVNHSSCPLCRASLKLDSSLPMILIQEPPVRYNLPL